MVKIDRAGWEEGHVWGWGGWEELAQTVEVLSEAMWPQKHTVSGTDLSTSHSNSWKLKKQKLSQTFTTTAWVVLWSSPTDEEYEAKRGLVTCPRSHNWGKARTEAQAVYLETMFSCPGLWLWVHHARPPPFKLQGFRTVTPTSFVWQTSAFFISGISGPVLLVPIMQKVGSGAPFDSHAWLVSMASLPASFLQAGATPAGSRLGLASDSHHTFPCSSAPCPERPCRCYMGMWGRASSDVRVLDEYVSPEGEGQPSRNVTVGNSDRDFGPKSLHWGPLLGWRTAVHLVWLKKRRSLTIRPQRPWESKGRKQKQGRKSGAKVFSLPLRWELSDFSGTLLGTSLPFDDFPLALHVKSKLVPSSTSA